MSNPNDFSTAKEDYFGDAVVISGNYCIVGAWGEDDGADKSGTAYIYNVTTGALLYTLDNPNPNTNGIFGRYMDIDGDFAIIGASSTGSGVETQSGKAYIYNVTTGTLVYTLDNPNTFGTPQDDFFGRAVAISGNRALVSAPGEDTSALNNRGKVYVYDVTTGERLTIVITTYSNGVQFVSRPIINNPGSTGNSFGLKVALSGNRAIVSANRENDDGGTESGKAYIFDIRTAARLQTLDNPNATGTSSDDRFSEQVAISGNSVIVTTIQEDDAHLNSGKAYIYR